MGCSILRFPPLSRANGPRVQVSFWEAAAIQPLRRCQALVLQLFGARKIWAPWTRHEWRWGWGKHQLEMVITWGWFMVGFTWNYTLSWSSFEDAFWGEQVNRCKSIRYHGDFYHKSILRLFNCVPTISNINKSQLFQELVGSWKNIPSLHQPLSNPCILKALRPGQLPFLLIMIVIVVIQYLLTHHFWYMGPTTWISHEFPIILGWFQMISGSSLLRNHLAPFTGRGSTSASR